jgi:hypothetical protein
METESFIKKEEIKSLIESIIREQTQELKTNSVQDDIKNSELPNFKSKFGQSRTNQLKQEFPETKFSPVPQYNYEIAAPDDGPASSIMAEINFESSDLYLLGLKNGELEWTFGLPKGENLGDMLYWDPEAGDEGEWVILSAPEEDGLKVLTINSGVLAWTNTEDCDSQEE